LRSGKGKKGLEKALRVKENQPSHLGRTWPRTIKGKAILKKGGKLNQADREEKKKVSKRGGVSSVKRRRSKGEEKERAACNYQQKKTGTGPPKELKRYNNTRKKKTLKISGD